MKLKTFTIGLCVALGIGLTGTLTYAGATGMFAPQQEISQSQGAGETEKDKQIGDLTQQLTDAKGLLKQKEDTLAEKEALLKQKETALQEKEAQLQAQKQETESQSARADGAEAQVEQLKQSVQQTQEEINRINEEIANIKSGLLNNLKIDVSQLNTSAVNFEIAGNDILFFARDTGALWYYDVLAGTMNFIENYDTSSSTTKLMPVSAGCFISSYSSDNKFFDPQTHKLYDVSSGLGEIKEILDLNNGCMLESGSFIGYFDYETKATLDTGFSGSIVEHCSSFYKTDNGCLVFSKYGGIQLFDEALKTYTKLEGATFTHAENYDYGYYTPDGILIGSNIAGNDLLYYDNEAKSITTIYNDSGVSNFIPLSEGCFILNTRKNLYFDYSTKECTSFADNLQFGTDPNILVRDNYNDIIEHDDDIYVFGRDKTEYNAMIGKFNKTDKSYSKVQDLNNEYEYAYTFLTDDGIYYTDGEYKSLQFFKFSDNSIRKVFDSSFSGSGDMRYNSVYFMFTDTGYGDFLIDVSYSTPYVYKIDGDEPFTDDDIVKIDDAFMIAPSYEKSARLVNDKIYMYNRAIIVEYDMSSNSIRKLNAPSSSELIVFWDDTHVIMCNYSGYDKAASFDIYDLTIESYHSLDVDTAGTPLIYDPSLDEVTYETVEDGLLIKIANYTYKITKDETVTLYSVSL